MLGRWYFGHLSTLVHTHIHKIGTISTENYFIFLFLATLQYHPSVCGTIVRDQISHCRTTTWRNCAVFRLIYHKKIDILDFS